MRYVFVTISIIAIWLSITVLIYLLNYTGYVLPLLALNLTIVIFEIGIGGKKWKKA